ncbi:MAG TPA: sugar ABC transporter permease, partial [Firmicutes bacterium]|nr:sugar ABC transporter permease [Bacillota bacterium]
YSLKLIGKERTDKDFIHDLVGSNYHYMMLGIPMVLLALFTIIPIIFMVIIGFTNFNSAHYPSQRLFDWVAWNNYAEVFSLGQDANGMVFLTTFGKVVLWTLVWAFFATFSNYFLGMIFALIINQKGIKLKKVWRTILITTIAVPQFVSLLIVSQMLNTDSGVFNNILSQLGWIDKNIQWLDDPLLAKVTIIIVNTWVGIPYTMLICTGILMNIPEDLYESAKIDGASPFKMYMKITLPYMLFVTGPYLISQFVGNINNFNVIYLLTGGNPSFNFVGQNAPGILLNSNVGQTDLLITWIYKLTKDSPSQDFGTASVLGVFTFVVVAVISMVFYNRSSAVKNEEDFQ